MKTQQRCHWAKSDPLLRAYHDEEWGVPEHDSRALWEKLMLDGFQAGLSWLIILRKREAFRKAFRNFDPYTVARFTEKDITRLLEDPGIVRSRAKIEATIKGARIYTAMEKSGEDFGTWIWYLAGNSPIINHWKLPGEVPPKHRSLKRSPSRLRSEAINSSARSSSTPGCRLAASSTTTPRAATAITPGQMTFRYRSKESKQSKEYQLVELPQPDIPHRDLARLAFDLESD